MDDVSKVMSELEENYFEQDIFGSRANEDIKVVKSALEVAEEYLFILDEEQSKISLCLEQTAIEWEENLEKCKLDEKEDCDEIEAFLDEIKRMRGNK